MSLAVVRDTALPSRPRRRQDVRQAVERLRRRYPRDGDRLAKALVDTLLDDRDLLLDVARFVIEKIAAIADTRQRMSRAAPSPRKRAERQATEKAAVTAAVAKVRELALLDLLMPNGVAMRFCSGTQMAGFGTAYAKIAERVGDAMVGEVMCEAEVKALLLAPA